MSIPEEKVVGGLRCGEVLKRLGDYLERELGTEDAAAVEAHLRGCNACERFGGAFSDTVGALRRSLEANEPLDEETARALADRVLGAGR